MIPIKIKKAGHKRYRKVGIPTFDELTTRQYLKFYEFEQKDVISYLAMCLNITRGNAALLYAKEPEKAEFLIGKEKNYENYKPERKYFLGHEIREIETLGQRYCIVRNSQKYEGFSLFVFILAVSLAYSGDLEKINKIYNLLLDENYYEVMGLGFFLLRDFEIGMIKELPILKRLPKLIKMKALKFRQALRNWINFLFIMKSKRFVKYSI